MIGQLTVIKNKGLDTVSGLGHCCVTDWRKCAKLKGHAASAVTYFFLEHSMLPGTG